MDSCPNRIALRRQAVSVPSHGMQDVESSHTFVSGDDVGCGVASGWPTCRPSPDG
jgi:hypothetical protein